MNNSFYSIFFLGASLLISGLYADEDSKFKNLTTAEALEDDTARKAVLHTIETRLGGLEYESGFPTSSTVQRLYDEMDYQRAVLAHQISDNLVSFYSMYTGPLESIYGYKMGDLAVWNKFLDTKGIVLTGNDTTVYGMIFLDLKKNGPMVVDVPKSPFLGSILDLWQVPLSGIDSKGGKFVVVTEDYEGKVDVPEGATLLRSRTSIAVFFARGLVIDGDMDSAVRAVTESQVYPLSKAASPPPTKA